MRFPTLFACAAALLLISAGASHAAAPAITGEMQKKYESMQSFTAEFTQRLVHQESGSEETRQGTLAFQKPLRGPLGDQSPPCGTFGHHGQGRTGTTCPTRSWPTSIRRKWSTTPAPSFRSSPARAASTRISPSRPSRTTTDWPCSGSTPKILLRQLVEALLWVDKGTKLIKKAQILDFYGNTNEVALTSLTPDASIKAGTFQFTPPQGITVENLMNQDAPERPLLQ